MKMLSPTSQHLNKIKPRILGTDVDANPAFEKNTMVGCYLEELRNSKSGHEVVVFGGGEVYQKMVGPALHHLGIKVHLHDPKLFLSHDDPGRIIPIFGETLVKNLDSAPRELPVLILSPNKDHATQARFFIERGQSVIVEKPVCLSEETEKLNFIVRNSSTSSYWIDFNHMMGRSLIAIAGGVKMPFMDSAQIESDTYGRVANAIAKGTTLIEGTIKKVTGYYLQAGNAVGGTIEHRSELLNVSKGGGMLRDLMTRQFNMIQLIGFSNFDIATSDLRLASRENPGEYIPITNVAQAEEYASVTGTMQHNNNEVRFGFAVGKYAKENNLNLTLHYDTGEKLRLEWLPPHRRNRVTWLGTDGAVKGSIYTRVDPYMLIVIDAFDHLKSKDPMPLYFPEQINSVQILAQAARIGRSGLDHKLTTRVA